MDVRLVTIIGIAMMILMLIVLIIVMNNSAAEYGAFVDVGTKTPKMLSY